MKLVHFVWAYFRGDLQTCSNHLDKRLGRDAPVRMRQRKCTAKMLVAV